MTAITKTITRLIMRRPPAIRNGEHHPNPFWRIKNLDTGAYLKIGRLKGDQPLKIALSDVPVGRYLIRSGAYSEVANFAGYL
jgi:hypothetical protein